MPDDAHRQALQSEYLYLQTVIEGFDGRLLTIKAWSITFSLAALASAFAGKSDKILLVAAGSALLFWFLEASWKTFQTAYYERAELIEKCFRGECLTAPFQIGVSWYKTWKAGGMGRLLQVMCWSHVAIPHAPIAIAATSLYLLNQFGVPCL